MSYPGNTTALRRRSAQAYANVGLETTVLGASPERLIMLLFQGAQAALVRARHHLHQQDVAARGAAISKAIDIVDSGLKASVDTDKGGELAQNLIATYDLISRHLLLANLRSDEQHLTIAENMLKDISQAWREVTDPASPESLAG